MSTVDDQITALNTAVNAYGKTINDRLKPVGTMASRNLLTGTTDPVSAQGVDGDVYLKTSSAS